jgi:hypothetical protein
MPDDSARALGELANFANGPLRLQTKMEEDVVVTYLGVRSWSTYFFEKLIATPAQIKEAKLKTRRAIERDVRSFLNNSGMAFWVNAEELTASLHAKVVGKTILPMPVASDDPKAKDKTGSWPGYAQRKRKLFGGVGTVHSGLSFSTALPLTIIADVRLVTKRTLAQHPNDDRSNGKTFPLHEPETRRTAPNAEIFKKYYLDELTRRSENIQTSVVMELQRDSGDRCSEANLDGAYAAAKEFAASMLVEKDKHVSIMLSVTKLPRIEEKKSAAGQEVDTGTGTGLGSLTDEDSDSD